MSMLTRTGTTVRKHRRRLSSKQRRGSAPTILLPSTVPATSTPPVSVDLTGKGHLNPQPSPAKSVSFTFEKGSVCPSIVDEAEVVPGVPVYEACSHHLVRDRSYSLVAALQEANLEAETTCDFVEKSCDIIFNTRLVTLLLGLLIAFPMAMMTAGGKYLDECPKEPKIPIYLLVGGCFGLFKLLFIMWRQVRRRYHDHMDDFVEGADAGEVVTISRMTSVSLSLFLCVWFVLGNYWVFSIWTPLFESPLHDPQNWCDRHVYMFAFWQIIICYVLITGFLLLCLFLLCCHWTLWCLATSPDSFC